MQPYFTVVFSLSVSTSIKAFSFCSQDIISCVWVGILPSLHGSWWVLLYSQEQVPGQMWVFAWGLSHRLLPQSLKTWPLYADVSSDLRSTFSAPFTSSNELDNVPDLFNLNSIPCRCFPAGWVSVFLEGDDTGCLWDAEGLRRLQHLWVSLETLMGSMQPFLIVLKYVC